MALMPKATDDTVYVICTSQADAVLIGHLLIPPFAPERVRALAATDAGMAVSLARTLLGSTPARVAVVIDPTEATRSDVESALAMMALRSRWAVFVFDPHVESLLAADPAAVGAVLQRALSETDRVRLAVDPTAFLRAEAAVRDESHVALVARLARRVDADKVREHAVFQTLFAFVSPAAVPVLAQAV